MNRSDRFYLRAAAIAVALIVVVTVGIFAKTLLRSGDELKAEFSSAAQLKKGSSVRIGGIEVGQVTGIAPRGDGHVIVTMNVKHDGIPIHDDARLSIQPRLLLEGNDAVEIDPGSPTAPVQPTDRVIPASRTDVPVQLDEVLGSLTQPVRTALVSTIGEFNRGLGPDTNPARPSGAQALHASIAALDGALDSARGAAHALRGQRYRDLRAALGSSGDVTAQLARDPAALAGFVDRYATIASALSDRDQQLRASVRGMAAVLRDAPQNLDDIDRMLPVLTRFGGELRPALTQMPPTLRSAASVLDQVQRISRPSELPALLAALRPTTSTLPRLEDQLTELFPQVTATSTCLTRNVIPVLDMKVPDGPNSTGDPVWLDALHMGATLAGGSPNFDGNGTTIRLGVAAGETDLLGVIPGIGKVAGGADVEGVSPAWMGYGIVPPFRPDVRCAGQPLPDLTKGTGVPQDGFENVRRVAATPAQPPHLRVLRRLLSTIGATGASR